MTRFTDYRLAVAVLLLCTDVAAENPTKERLNVVIMLADNLGFGDVSVYNNGIRGGMRTPNIDKFAAEGLRLTQFLVEPICTGSRVALMTGRYPIRSGLSWFAGDDPNTLQDGEFTMGELFRAAGYATAYVGKWHLDADPRSQPQNQGFDEWRVGFFGSTGSVLYPDGAAEFGAPANLRKVAQYWIVEADLKEQVNLSAHVAAWTQWPYWEPIDAYTNSIKRHPNPPALDLTGSNRGEQDR